MGIKKQYTYTKKFLYLPFPYQALLHMPITM